MNEKLSIKSERIDDIPVLMAQMEKMGVAVLLNKEFPTNGNWQGLSLGEVAVVWLTFIISESNHRLSHVQNWAAQRLNILHSSLGQSVRELDFSDDRLSSVLDYLSKDSNWNSFEQSLNQNILRVYDLQANRVRVDSSTAKGYVAVSDEGLFQFGQSKDHRPDLPQLKINISTLDPLGLPLTTTIVSGEKADDPLYVPEIKRVKETLGVAGVTYIGDCKMAALQTRAYLVKEQDYYLCPLSSVQLNDEAVSDLLADVWDGKQSLTPIYQVDSQTKIAEGFEYSLSISAQLADSTIEWTERRLVIRSLQYQQSQQQALDERIEKALADIAKLTQRAQGKKRFTQQAELQQAVEKILTKHKVSGLLRLDYHCEVIEKPLRRYGNREASSKVESSVDLVANKDEAAITALKRSLGWRVYATNQLADELPLDKAVLAYRAEYLIEQAIGRLKGKPLSLTPIYFNNDKRVVALVRLLMIALRVLTLLDFTARKQLQLENSKLAGIYLGNPKRATNRPTAESMLQAFKGLTLTLILELQQAHVTPLSELHRRILHLLGLNTTIFERLAHFLKPTLNLSEP